MSTKRKSGKVTIANIISIIGIVLLLGFTYMGLSYKSGGELGHDIILSIAITAFTTFLLWFLIKAKGAENNIIKWKIAEILTLIIYIAFAVYTGLFGGIMHFFVINDNKEEIKKYAKMDLQKINNMFYDYKEFENNAIVISGTGLKNATGQGQLRDEKLSEFLNHNNIEPNQESAQNYEIIQRNKLVGTGFEGYHRNIKKQLDGIDKVINSWSIMLVPSKANLIDELATNAEKELTKLSKGAQLPVIATDSINHSIYTIQKFQEKDFKIKDGIKSFKFKKALQETEGFNSIALLVVILIHFLILFNYIFAYRTATIGIGKNMKEDGGIVLKF